MPPIQWGKGKPRTASNAVPVKRAALSICRSGISCSRYLSFSSDEGHDSGGVIVNPEHEADNSQLLFLNKENIKNIIQIAEDAIQKHEEPFRSILQELD